jgi:hypothetical protein
MTTTYLCKRRQEYVRYYAMPSWLKLLKRLGLSRVKIRRIIYGRRKSLGSDVFVNDLKWHWEW